MAGMHPLPQILSSQRAITADQIPDQLPYTAEDLFSSLETVQKVTSLFELRVGTKRDGKRYLYTLKRVEDLSNFESVFAKVSNFFEKLYREGFHRSSPNRAVKKMISDLLNSVVLLQAKKLKDLFPNNSNEREWIVQQEKLHALQQKLGDLEKALSNREELKDLFSNAQFHMDALWRIPAIVTNALHTISASSSLQKKDFRTNLQIAYDGESVSLNQADLPSLNQIGPAISEQSLVAMLFVNERAITLRMITELEEEIQRKELIQTPVQEAVDSVFNRESSNLQKLKSRLSFIKKEVASKQKEFIALLDREIAKVRDILWALSANPLQPRESYLFKLEKLLNFYKTLLLQENKMGNIIAQKAIEEGKYNIFNTLITEIRIKLRAPSPERRSPINNAAVHQRERVIAASSATHSAIVVESDDETEEKSLDVTEITAATNAEEARPESRRRRFNIVRQRLSSLVHRRNSTRNGLKKIRAKFRRSSTQIEQSE